MRATSLFIQFVDGTSRTIPCGDSDDWAVEDGEFTYTRVDGDGDEHKLVIASDQWKYVEEL